MTTNIDTNVLVSPDPTNLSYLKKPIAIQVLRNLLDLKSDHPILLWAQANDLGNEDILTMVQCIMDPSVLREPFEDSTTKKDRKLKSPDMMRLKQFAEYVQTSIALDPNHDFQRDSHDDFTQFRMNSMNDISAIRSSPHSNPGTHVSFQTPADVPPAATPATMTSTSSQSHENKTHYAKRELDSYKEVKNRNQFLNWIHATLAFMDIQGVQHMDPSIPFTPSTPEEQEQHRLDLTFTWLILNQCIKYPSGQLIVQSHKQDKDGRVAIAELMDDAGSPIVVAQASEIQEENLRNLCADPNKGFLENFLDKYMKALLRLNEILEHPVTDNEFKAWLTKSLLTHPAARTTLDGIQLINKQITNVTGKDVPFNREAWIKNLRLSFQQIDRANSDAAAQERKANKASGQKKSNRKGNKSDNSSSNTEVSNNNSDTGNTRMSKADYLKYTEKVKSIGMWIDPEKFKQWSSDKKASHRKATAEKLRKAFPHPAQAERSTQSNQSTTNSHPAPSATSTYADATKYAQPETHPPGSMQHALSHRNAQSPADDRTIQTGNLSSGNGDVLQYKGRWYRACVGNRMFHSNFYAGKHSDDSHLPDHSLIDSGCNGGLAGRNALILNEDMANSVTVTGIAGNKIRDVPIVQAAEKAMSNRGPVILVMNQYAKSNQAQTIHSTIQLRDFGTYVDDVPTYQHHNDGTPGTQSLHVIHEGTKYSIGLRMVRGLAHIPDTQTPSWEEMEDPNIPKIHLTAPTWNPDDFTDDTEQAADVHDGSVASSAMTELSFSPSLEAFFTDSLTTNPTTTPAGANDDIPTDITAFTSVPSTDHNISTSIPTTSARAKWKSQETLDIKSLRPNFAFLPDDRIKRTLEMTTQLYRQYKWGNKMKRHFKPRFPGANVKRTNETVATDTLQWHGEDAQTDVGILGYAGATAVQLFVGLESKHIFAYPCQTDASMNKAIEEYIRKIGAPEKLRGDGAKALVNNETVAATFRKYSIDNGTSEPFYQNQNPCERHVQDVRNTTESLMQTTATPGRYWLLCLLFVISLLNHSARETINFRTPMERKFGTTPDTSKFLCFRWWEPIYYLEEDGSTQYGRWAGIAEHVGDELTWIVISGKTGKALYRSDVRTATDPNRPNLRAEAECLNGPSLDSRHEDATLDHTDDTDAPTEEGPPVLTLAPGPSANTPRPPAPFTPAELIGKVFLRPGPEGDLIRTRVTRILEEDRTQRADRVRFLVQRATDSQHGGEDIMDYNAICDLVQHQMEACEARARGEPDDALYSFKRILAHEGPLQRSDTKHKGCPWNLLIDWDGAEPTWVPRSLILDSDPISVATYARENHLLQTPGWKQFNRRARLNRKAIRRLRRLMKGHRGGKGPQFIYGVRIPDRQKSPRDLDRENGNTLWADAQRYEIGCYDKHEVFEDMGPATQELINRLLAQGFQRIRLIWSYAVKHDGTRRARLCAGGHTTIIEIEFTTSCSVVALRTLRTVLVLAELNGLKIMVADICSAYLLAQTKERIFFIAGPEFGERAGHLMVMRKACYGLRTSGKRYHDMVYDLLKEFGFRPSLADPDIYMRESDTGYEYVCVYVDDLTIAMKEPEKLLEQIRSRGIDLKDVSAEPTMFLGGSVSRDKDGTLAWGALRYIKRSLDELERINGSRPEKKNVPIPENTHPEIDTTTLLNREGIQRYQTLMGMLQWIVTLGRFDIGCAVMTLGRFRTAPREGHLALIHHVFGYLRKYPDGAIRFRTGIPNHEAAYLPVQREWEKTVYGEVTEELPPNMPEPRGKPVRVSAWFDANLYHDLTTGRSAMGQLVMVNQTPIHWSSKRQGSVETATYATEFIAGRVCVDEVIQTRFELRMLGAPLDGPAWVFGDNQSMINSSMLPEGRLTKRASALSFHRVREQVCMGVVYLFHIAGNLNITDCMTKFLSARMLHPLIQPVLFRKGETADCGLSNIIRQCHAANIIPIEVKIGECQPDGIVTVAFIAARQYCDQGGMALSSVEDEGHPHSLDNDTISFLDLHYDLESYHNP